MHHNIAKKPKFGICYCSECFWFICYNLKVFPLSDKYPHGNKKSLWSFPAGEGRQWLLVRCCNGITHNGRNTVTQLPVSQHLIAPPWLPDSIVASSRASDSIGGSG